MKKFFIAVLTGVALLVTSFAFAKDVNVKGYYRKDGTYVRGHTRSSPDSYKWNNFGQSRNDYERTNPHMRDYDRDVTPNYLDKDDDNDGKHDDSNDKHYG